MLGSLVLSCSKALADSMRCCVCLCRKSASGASVGDGPDVGLPTISDSGSPAVIGTLMGVSCGLFNGDCPSIGVRMQTDCHTDEFMSWAEMPLGYENNAAARGFLNPSMFEVSC